MPTEYVIFQKAADDSYTVIGVEEGREPSQARDRVLARRKPEDRSGRFAGAPSGNWHEWDTETEVDVRTTSERVKPTWATDHTPEPEDTPEEPSEGPQEPLEPDAEAASANGAIEPQLVPDA